MRQRHQYTTGFILLTVMFTVCCGHAEEERLSIRALAAEKVEMPVWHIATDTGEYKELTWPVEQPSSAIMSTAGRELPLFSKETNAEGEEEYNMVRKLTIPEPVTEILLVAWPVDGEGKTELMIVVDGRRQAGFNDWMLINTSKQKVSVRYGADSQAVQLEPVEAKPCRIDSEQGHGSAVLAQAKMKDEWKTIYSTYWAAPEKQRSLVLFYEKDKRVRLRRVIDILEPAE